MEISLNEMNAVIEVLTIKDILSCIVKITMIFTQSPFHQSQLEFQDYRKQ